MAIPRFGFLKIEALACVLMVVAGVAGLLLSLMSGWITASIWPRWVLPHVSLLWLVPQSLAVLAGGIGAWRSLSFVLAAVGVDFVTDKW